MYKVVSADGKPITITADLPNGKVWVDNFCSCGDSGSTSVNSLHSVIVHIIGQSAAAPDAADNGSLIRWYADFSHCLVEAGEEEMVAASGTPSWLSLFEVLWCILLHIAFLFRMIIQE